MPENLSWVISALSIILCVFCLRRQRNAGAGRNNAGRRSAVQAQDPPRTPVQTGRVVYFASDGYGLPSREYHFDYRKVNGAWRAYILKMPALNGRSSSSSATHRLSDGNMRYVCWNRPIRTLQDCQTVSRAWADNLQRYIATGQTF